MSDVSLPTSNSDHAARPHFEISVEDGRGLLLLRPRTFYGWLRVVELELLIPHVSFPLDITGGMAQFQKQRLLLQRAGFVVGELELAALLRNRQGALRNAGFDEVRVRLREGAVDVSGRARLGGQEADFTGRLHVEIADPELRLVMTGAQTLGYLRRPAPLLLHDLMCVLLGAAQPAEGEAAATAPVIRGLGVVGVQALDLFLTRVLPPAGWRLPDASQVRVSVASMTAAGAELRYAAGAELPAQAGPPPASAGDELLLRNDVAGAAAAYRAELGRQPDQAPLVVDRLLSVLCARDNTLRDAEALAHDALKRWPDYVPAYRALATIGLARGRTDEPADHLERMVTLAEAAGDEELAVRGALAAARLFGAADPARAASLYQRVTVHRPNEQEAVHALAELHAAAGRWPELLRLLREQIAATVDPLARAQVHVRVGEVLLGKLTDLTNAARELEQAVRLDEQNRRAWELLSRVRIEQSQPEAALAALEKLAGLLTGRDDAPLRKRTQLRIAQLREDVADLAGAQAIYRTLLEGTPDDADALEKSAALSVRQGEPGEAIRGYQRLVQTCPARQERRRRAERELLKLLVAEGRLDDARGILGQSSGELDPESLVTLAALEEGAGSLEAAQELLARASAQVDAPRAAELIFERARLLASLGRPAERLAALGAAYERAPDSPTGAAAARALAEAARAHDQPDREAVWLDLLLGFTPPVADRDSLTVRRAQLFLEAGDPRQARQQLERLFAAPTLPDAAQTRRLYADVLGALGDRIGRAVELETLALGAVPPEQLTLLVEAMHSRLAAGDLEGARETTRRAEAIAPDDRIVRMALGEIAWHVHDWDQVLAIYQPLLPSTEGEGGERIEVARRIGVACEKLGRAADALAAYRVAVDTTDAEGEPLAACWVRIGELHERLGNYPLAADAFVAAGADERTGEPPPARASHYVRAAELIHRRLGDHLGAFARLDEALRLAPGHAAALDALESIASELGDDARVADALRRKIAAAPTDAHKLTEWLARVAEVEKSLHRPEAAREAYRQVLARDPRFRPALRYLAADALETGDRAAIVQYHLQLAQVEDSESDPTLADERLQALRTLARLALEDGRQGDAEEHLWAAAALAPEQLKSALLSQLEAFHDQAGRFSEVAVVLAHHIGVVSDPAVRLQLDLRRARLLLDQLHDPSAAIEACHQALARAPTDAQLLETLVQAARAADDPAEEAEALGRLLNLPIAPALKAEHLLAAAELYRNRLLDPDRALALFGRLGELALPADALLALLERVPAVPAAHLARLEADRAGPGELRAAALRIAAARAREATDLTGELDHLWLLHAEQTADVAARERLGQLLDEAGRTGEATAPLAEALATHAGELAAHAQPLDATGERLLSALRKAVAAGSDPVPADALARAAEALRGVLAHRPDDDALRSELEALLDGTGQLERLLDLWEEQLSQMSGEARVPVLERLARLAAEGLGDTERAERYLAEVRSLQPPPPPEPGRPTVKMNALFRAMGAPREAGPTDLTAAIDALRAELHTLPANKVERLRAVRLQLSELYRHVGNPKAARAQLETVLAEQPSCVPALTALCEMNLAEEQYAEAAHTLHQLSQRLTEPTARAGVLYRLGELYRVQLEDEERASEAWLKAIDLDPRHVPTLRRLVDYYGAIGDSRSLLELGKALNLEGGLFVGETSPETMARVGLEAMLAGDRELALESGRALGSRGAAALAGAAAEAARRTGEPRGLTEALRAICRAPGPALEAVKAALAARGPQDPRALELSRRL